MAADVSDDSSGVTGATPSPHRQGRILVVEDDPGTLDFLALALERSGFEVATATSAGEGLELLATHRFDVLLADIGLPGMSGFDLVREAKRLDPDLAIALMTADARVDVAVQALRSDVDDFLPKPISPVALIEQVDRLIERRHAKKSGPPQQVLAIGAHPDDVEIGVGGILLGHREAHDQITILTLSHGARGGDAAIRAEEASKAAALLGAELILGNLDDTRIAIVDPTVGMIEDAIAATAPAIVYTHTLCDLHQDHRNVHRASMVAARNVPSVYCYESPSATVKFEPVRFVSIDGAMEGKLEAIRSYQSQTAVRSYLDEELVRATARYWGRFGQTRYCEPLEVVRDRPPARSFGPGE